VKKKHETTKADFNYFQERVKFWLNKFKCDEYEIFFFHKDIGDSSAMGDIDHTSMQARIFLNVHYGSVPTRKELDRDAFHEVFEGVILGPLIMFSLQSCADRVVFNESHRIVQKMANMFLGY